MGYRRIAPLLGLLLLAAAAAKVAGLRATPVSLTGFFGEPHHC
jgi:hypothetical protein